MLLARENTCVKVTNAFFDLLWREISQPITMLRNEVKSPQIVSFIFPIHQRKVCFCRFLSHGYKCTHTLIFRRKHSLQWYYAVCIGKNVQVEITFYSSFCHFFLVSQGSIPRKCSCSRGNYFSSGQAAKKTVAC